MDSWESDDDKEVPVYNSDEAPDDQVQLPPMYAVGGNGSQGRTSNTLGSPQSPRSPFLSLVLQLGSQPSSSSPSSIGAGNQSFQQRSPPNINAMSPMSTSFNRGSPSALRTPNIGPSYGTMSAAAAMTPRAPSRSRAFDRNELQPVARNLNFDRYGNYVLNAPSFRTPPSGLSSNAAPSGLDMAPRATRSRPIDRQGLQPEILNFDGQVNSSAPSCRTPPSGWSSNAAPMGLDMAPRATRSRPIDRRGLQPEVLNFDGQVNSSAPSYRTPPSGWSSNAAPYGLDMAPRATRSRPIDRRGLQPEILNFDGQVNSSAPSSVRTPPSGWSSNAAPYGLDMAPRATRSRPIDRRDLQPELLNFDGQVDSSYSTQRPE